MAKPATKSAPSQTRPLRPSPIEIQPGQPSHPSQPKLVAYAQEIPVAAYKIEMLPIPGTADGKIKPFYMSKTELGWEAFDVYIYRLDEEAGKAPKGAGADAITRPSKPYLPPDRGFGHEGYAAISMSHKNATEFCKWLSAQTGKTYRLATEAEWEHAARAGGADPDAAQLENIGWIESNSNDTPHPVGKKLPNAWGLHDMIGNVAEWVDGGGADGKPVTKGGSYKDAAGNEALTITARAPLSRDWNGSDPQVPKSKWWLADAPFIGFRIVCETGIPAGAVAKSPTSTTPASPEKKP